MKSVRWRRRNRRTRPEWVEAYKECECRAIADVCLMNRQTMFFFPYLNVGDFKECRTYLDKWCSNIDVKHLLISKKVVEV